MVKCLSNIACVAESFIFSVNACKVCLRDKFVLVLPV